MALKSFEIDFEGAKTTIEYESELTFGEIEAIINRSVDLTDFSKPKMNIPQYRMDILMKVIRTAPFKTGDAVAIRNQKAGTVQQIISGVMKDYPLQKHLGAWVETFTGSQMSEDRESQSTTSVQLSSAGQKKK